jgi:hypothetical protein
MGLGNDVKPIIPRLGTAKCITPANLLFLGFFDLDTICGNWHCSSFTMLKNMIFYKHVVYQ